MQFLIDSAIKNGWSLAKKNFWFIILILITIAVIQGIFYSLIFLIWGTTATETLGLVPNIIINVVSMIIGIFTNIGRKNINLQIAIKGSTNYLNFWNKMPKLFFKLLWAVIIYVLVVIVLFVIPGLLFYFGFQSQIIFLMILAGILGIVASILMMIFVIRVQFFVYFILDKGFRGCKAIKQSREITKGHFRELIGFSMAKGILIIFGAILAGIGLLRAIPACQIATADVYRKLIGTAKSTVASKPVIASKAAVKKPLRKIVRKTK